MLKMMQFVIVVIIKEDHEDRTRSMMIVYIEDCKCTKFESFQVNLLKKKKTVTDI